MRKGKQMLSEVKKIIDSLDEEENEAILNYFGKSHEPMEDSIRKKFDEIIQKSCELIKKGTSQENVVECFRIDMRHGMSEAIDRAMLLYRDFGTLRKMSKEEGLRAKYLVDFLWEQKIIRVSRDLILPDEFDGYGLDEIIAVEHALEFVVERCVASSFTYEAMEEQFREEAGVTDELAAYIARKIDHDFKDLQLKIIMQRLTFLRNSTNISI